MLLIEERKAGYAPLSSSFSFLTAMCPRKCLVMEGSTTYCLLATVISLFASIHFFYPRRSKIIKMGLLHLLIAALAASAAMAEDKCACVNEKQTIDPISNPMMFFQQPTIGGVMNGMSIFIFLNYYEMCILKNLSFQAKRAV